MPDAKHFGRQGEALAAEHLQKCGYTILEHNYRTRTGEIDIVARERGTLVFVEVKARRSDHFGSPKWAITPRKKQKMVQVALHYLKAHHRTSAKARFDVVAIRSSEAGHAIELIRNAFELNDA